MRVEELRIGNYFQWSEFASMGIGVDVCTKENIFNYLQLKEPIPLTEEWLLKFGFEKPASSWCGDKFHLTTWDRYPDCWCVALNKNNAILVDKLKHVHQLQNLYHALCQEELKIKEI